MFFWGPVLGCNQLAAREGGDVEIADLQELVAGCDAVLFRNDDFAHYHEWLIVAPRRTASLYAPMF